MRPSFKLIPGGKTMSEPAKSIQLSPGISSGTPEVDPETIRALVVDGDLSRLTSVQQVKFYNILCETLGLNPMTKPFGYIKLQGKLTLYALKNCTDQLRSKHKIDLAIKQQGIEGSEYSAHVVARMPSGRQDEDIGVVSIEKLSGEMLCNAKMKAVTKAKRRVTLSLCGLSFLDESEIDTVKGAQVVRDPIESKISEVGSLPPARPTPTPFRIDQVQRSTLFRAMTTNRYSKRDLEAFTARYARGRYNTEEEFLETVFAMSQSRDKGGNPPWENPKWVNQRDYTEREIAIQDKEWAKEQAVKAAREAMGTELDREYNRIHSSLPVFP
jgi:hypothetical protein